MIFISFVQKIIAGLQQQQQQQHFISPHNIQEIKIYNTWHHGSYVEGQKQEQFYPLETPCKFFWIFFIVLTTTEALPGEGGRVPCHSSEF